MPQALLSAYMEELPRREASRQLSATRAARSAMLEQGAYRELDDALSSAAGERTRHIATNPGADELAALGIVTETVPKNTG